MTRSTKRSETQPATCPPAWLWLLAGLFIGIFVSFLFYLKQLAPQPTTHNKTEAQAAATSQAQAPNTHSDLQLPPPEQTKPEAPPPRFEFYDMLPQSQITPPHRPSAAEELARIQREDSQSATQAAIPPPMRPQDFPVAGEPYLPALGGYTSLNPPNAAPATNAQPTAGQFMLQVASFRDLAAAHDLQAQLQQQGYSVNIQQAFVQGQQWYRLKMGPYATQAQALHQLHKLQQQGQQPMLQKGRSAD